MPETFLQPLQQTCVSVFEQLAFFSTEPADGPTPSTTGDGIVGVDFMGPLKGRLLVRLSDGALPAFAANMLGTDSAPDADRQRDAFGELANVICGNVLPRIAGDDSLFELSVPCGYPSWEEARDGAGGRVVHAALRIDSGRADVLLCLR
jgi:CheY-specific phosphatase CheX